jgi:hypothetical protein
MRNLVHYVTIETSLSTVAQPREQKRTSDNTTCTPTGIPQMKSAKWGRITVKYNYVRIQEYVDGNRGHTIVSS